MFGIGGSYLADVDETLWRLRWTVRAYVSNVATPPPAGLDPVVDVEDLTDELRSLPAVIPVANPAPRQLTIAAARTAGFREVPAVVDPTSVLARSVDIGEGVLVNAMVVIAPNVQLRAFATINRGCSIGHDTEIGVRSFLGPSVVLCGSVRVGDGAFLGAGAIVRPGAVIGAGATVGAGAVVVGDVPDDATVVGNPARVRHG